MQCPRCESELGLVLEGLFEDIESYVCPDCEGAFHPAGSLDRLDESLVVDTR